MLEDSGTTNKSASSPDLPNADYVNLDRRPFKRSREEENMEGLLDRYSHFISERFDSFKVELEANLLKLHDNFKTDIKSDLDLIKSELKLINQQHSALAESHAELVQRVDLIEVNTQDNSSLICHLKDQVSNLRLDLNTIQQRERLQNLEISGIPEKPSENLSTYMMNIAKFVGVDGLSPKDIEFITRPHTHNKTSNRPRIIIVKLKTRILRDSIISGARSKKVITTADIGISAPGGPSRIFVNEHLTPSNKLLYLQARRKKASSDFSYVWVRDGQIYARKSDKSPLFIIRSAEDLVKIS